MIAVVVPTIREEQYKLFCDAWHDLFDKHNVVLVTVWDGDEPRLDCNGQSFSVEDVMGKEDASLIFNKTDACRNLGFAYIAKRLPLVDIIITLDDDTRPELNDDAIQSHIIILNLKFPTSWLSTVKCWIPYMRGFPYCIREESKIMVSHGVWAGVPDLDAKTQLEKPYTDFTGNEFYCGVVPRGINIPFCGMNVAFVREALSFMYYAPMGYRTGYHRWADILLGMQLTKELAAVNGAMFTGVSTIYHSKASDPIKNLELEKDSIELGEYIQSNGRGNPKHDQYIRSYAIYRERWRNWIKQNDAQRPT
jgi:hypothetical protein